MQKLDYSPELRRKIESFLKERKRERFLNFVSYALNTFFCIFLFRESTLFGAFFCIVGIAAECVAFFHLFSVDHILRPRFENGVMLNRESERKLLSEWAFEKSPDEFRRVNFLISEALGLVSEEQKEE